VEPAITPEMEAVVKQYQHAAVLPLGCT
jgi:hypothetical protein